jgi:hypothetical protein
MDALVTLLATLAGAGIAFFSQWIFDRRQRTDRLGKLILKYGALLLAVNEDFENRLWEERVLGLKERVDNWDLASSRRARLNLEILSADPILKQALSRLHSTGVAVGSYWRINRSNDKKLEALLADHQVARKEFQAATSVAVRKVFDA